ncbi:MAG: DUF5665 domain-containing protein [Firmicutes bacterium]|jgi:hypothetical protein|nr:DUF5665 domain-containing protein [Bacillota bacterium]
MGARLDSDTERSLERLGDRLERFAHLAEKMKLADYVDLLLDSRRLLYVNFVAGLARGVGMAVGFTFLGAIVVYALSRILMRSFVINLPILGGIIAQIVRAVQLQLGP